MKQVIGDGYRRFSSFHFGFGLRSSISLCAVALALVAITGCGEFFTPVNNNPGGGTASYVYVTNGSSTGTGGTLTAYSLVSGVLTQLSGSPITLPATPTSIVVAPNNAFLYVGTQEGVFLYTIASDGTLTEGNDDTVVYLNASNPTVASLAVDSTNSWLLIASQGSNQLAALAIDSSTGIPPSVTPASATLSYAGPVQMSISPANNNVVVALGTGGTNVFGFNASNTSTPWGTEVTIDLHSASDPTATTPAFDASVAANAVAFDTTSTYVLVGETLQSTTQAPANDLLRLIPVASLNTDKGDYAIGRGPTSILADITGAYVYVANKLDNSISAFSIGAGALTALTDAPFPAAKGSVALLEDNSKSYVLDAGIGTNPDLWVYNFDTVTPGNLDVKTTATTGTTDPSLANAMAVTH